MTLSMCLHTDISQFRPKAYGNLRSLPVSDPQQIWCHSKPLPITLCTKLTWGKSLVRRGVCSISSCWSLLDIAHNRQRKYIIGQSHKIPKPACKLKVAHACYASNVFTITTTCISMCAQSLTKVHRWHMQHLPRRVNEAAMADDIYLYNLIQTTYPHISYPENKH